jgi:hypothetical protein
LKCNLDDVQLSRREIREATGWSDWQVRNYCYKLVEMEYLYTTVNGNGRPCVYSLARADEGERQTLRGLTDVTELKQRLKEKAVAHPGNAYTGTDGKPQLLGSVLNLVRMTLYNFGCQQRG